MAEEVRNLAMRSAEAAKETAKMIEESVKNSDNGVKIADEVGKSLLEIADGAGKVNNLVAEIAAASREQAQGIDQVNIAMGQMDKVTQANASAAEESASAAEELSAQSTQLADVVAAFSITRTGNGGASRSISDTLYTGDVSLVKQAAQQKAQRRAEMSRSQKELVGVGAGKKRGGGSVSGGNGGNGGSGKKKAEIVIPMDDEDYSNF